MKTINTILIILYVIILITTILNGVTLINYFIAISTIIFLIFFLDEQERHIKLLNEYVKIIEMKIK